jgi:hypothetical protein
MQIWGGVDRITIRGAYFDSLAGSMFVRRFKATIAEAVAIPISAIAINSVCILDSPCAACFQLAHTGIIGQMGRNSNTTNKALGYKYVLSNFPQK